MYSVLPYTKQQAKRIGVTVKPSSNPEKKLDVFEDGDKVASIGAKGYFDYPTYLKEKGKVVAEERRRLYHLRHKRGKKGTAGYYASVLLW
jgi:hypothetical protein